MKTGILPLGRPTFDVEFANEKLAAMLGRLDGTGREFAGPRELLFDAERTREAIADLKQAHIDRLLILQVTFTDASMTVEAVEAHGVPLSIWAVPEPRLGGRSFVPADALVDALHDLTDAEVAQFKNASHRAAKALSSEADRATQSALVARLLAGKK